MTDGVYTTKIAHPVSPDAVGFATLWFTDSSDRGYYIQNYEDDDTVTNFVPVAFNSPTKLISAPTVLARIGSPVIYSFLVPGISQPICGSRHSLVQTLEPLVQGAELGDRLRQQLNRFVAHTVALRGTTSRIAAAGSVVDARVRNLDAPALIGPPVSALQPAAMRWYIIHAYSNSERAVVDSILDQAKKRGLESLFEQVLVPMEKVTAGRNAGTERKFFPGYVLAKMYLTDEAFHLIKNTPKVTGFLGSENKPMPISEAEAMRILHHQVQEGVGRPKVSLSFEIGENVRVADGPFASFSGVVEEIDEARSRVKVAVSIFGRNTPIELEFGQVEKPDW